jgi:hypothetical protein
MYVCIAFATVSGNTVVGLYQHPEQLALLLDNPGLAPGAIQESLRYNAPLQFYWRQATEDVEVAGVVVPRGARVLVMPGSADGASGVVIAMHLTNSSTLPGAGSEGFLICSARTAG